MTKTKLILCACVTIALAMMPTASAGTSVAISAAGAALDDTMGNDADNEQGANNLMLSSITGRGSTNSFANCQMALLFNTIIANLAAADSLALVDEDLLVEGRVATDSIGWEESPTWENTTSESSCAQDMGAVVVAMEAADGWGEPAPQGDSIASMGEALWSPQQVDGDGGVAVSIAAAGTELDDLLENDFESYQGSGVNAASSCQILVAWNTLVINAGLASASSESDSNETIGDGGPPIIQPLSKGEPIWYEGNELESSTSSCSQTIASLTLIIGDTPEIPPQS